MIGPQHPFAQQLHATKYRQPDETFEGGARRVAHALADNSTHFAEFLDITVHQRFMPAGRVQAAMGAPKEVTPYNCYVAPTIEDSFVDGEDSIMGVAAKAAATMRMGGGIGYDFSTLRPKGALIRGLGSASSGPRKFMDIFNAVCHATSSAGNRRGAQMGVLRVDHPDIMEFVLSKNNIDQLNGFNISVAVTDEFMEAVYAGNGFDLKFGGQKYDRVPARELYEAMMLSTWDWAEPGILFIDTINRRNNLWYCERIAATNPCFTGDTKVWTDRGHKAFRDLVGQTVNVLTQDWKGRLVYRPMSDIRVTQRAAKLVEVRFSDGQVVRCTPNHMFFLKGGGQLEAERLQPGTSVASVYRHAANQKGYLRLTNGDHAPLEHHVPFEEGVPPGHEVHHIDEVKTHNWPENLQLLTGTEHRALHMRGDRNPSRRFPERNHFANADFSGEANGRFRPELDTGAMLEMRERGASFAEIASAHGCSKFTARKRVLAANHTVAEVVVLDHVEDVYCGSVDEFHRFFVATGDNDGVLVHNCGEQPLPPNGACLLGSFNAVKYVRRCRVTHTWYFDFDAFKADIPAVVRAMDNVVDRALYPLPAQEVEAKSKRRMGLGFTGLANAIEACGHPYGSPDYLAMHDLLHDILRDEAYLASADLAAEKGSFPLFDAELFLQGEFARSLPEHVQHAIRTKGLRNSHLTSIAPTGTISMTADNVSSGLECTFEEVTSRPVIMPEGTVQVTMEDYGVKHFGTKPKTTEHVTLDEHLAVLLSSSRRVDSAVSKTCNTAGNATPWGDFKALYQRAWEGGAKGITTFNKDGKRLALLTAAWKSNQPEPEAPAQNDNEQPAEACTFDPASGRRSCE